MADIDANSLRQLIRDGGRMAFMPIAMRMYYLSNKEPDGSYSDLWAVFCNEASDDLHATYLDGGNKENWWKDVTLLWERGSLTDAGKKFMKGVDVPM